MSYWNNPTQAPTWPRWSPATETPTAWPTGSPSWKPTWRPTWKPTEAVQENVAYVLDCSFRGVQQLNNGLTLQQITNPEEGTVTIELSTTKQAWLAFGWGTQMVGSTPVIGLPETGEVSKRFLGSKSPSNFANVDSNSLTDASITQSADGTVLRFTKPLIEQGETAVLTEGTQSIIVAAGFGNTFGIHEDYAVLQVRFDACLEPGETPAVFTDSPTASPTISPTQAPTVTQKPTSPPLDIDADDLDCTLRSQLDITSGVSVRQVTNQVEKTVTVEMTYENDEGAWLGIALASNGFMVGNTAVIGLPDDPVEPGVNPAKYQLGAKSASAVTRLPDDQQDLTDANIVQNATHTVLSFTTPLVAEGQREILADGETNAAIFATGRGNSFSDGLHTNFGAFSLQLTPCLEPGQNPEDVGAGAQQADLFNDESPNKGLWRLHGLLMALGWGFLVPIAIAASLLRSLFPENMQGLWFKLHRGLNSAALACIVIGFMLAIYLINDATAPGEDARHFRDVKHRTIGLWVVVLGVLQGLSGFLRPHLPHAKHSDDDKSTDLHNNRASMDAEQSTDVPESASVSSEPVLPPKSIQRRFFEIQHRILAAILLLMAWRNIDTGLTLFAERFDANDATTGFWVWIVLLLASVAGLKFYARTRQ